MEATMSDDLKLVKQLQKKTGIKLKRVSLEEIGDWKVTGFEADDNGRVRGLAIWDIEMRYPPALLSKFQRLEKLGLGINQISDISSLKELKGLTDLNLGNNQISDISSLKELKNLKQLYLQFNKITHMPAEFLDLGLEIKWDYDGKGGIYLQDNPLESPPVEIIKKGNEAIRQYFKSLAREQQALNEVKVLLVGDGAAGKTSLVKQLLGKKFDKNESQTHGININTMEITRNNSKIKVRLWDFGGQEIMHATHQFFLSKRSLYILVLDGRKDEKTEYWLNHIKSFGGDSPVMVVLNKIDENPGFDVNRRFLKEKYPNIKGFYPLSCAHRTGIDTLKNALSKELASVELIRTTWPKSWFKVKEHLENMSQHFIDYGRYRYICAGVKINSETEREILVDFLNDLGVILHFREFHLEDTHVLEPKWLTNAVLQDHQLQTIIPRQRRPGAAAAGGDFKNPSRRKNRLPIPAGQTQVYFPIDEKIRVVLQYR
jgi:small GTP-binding protein